MIAPCINSTGTDGNCASLFQYTTTPGGSVPANTVNALLNIARNPSLNDGSLYGLVTANAPFQPSLTQAPATFAVALTQIAVQFSPSTLTFPSAVVGTLSAFQTVTLSNPSSTTLSLSGLSITGTNAADFTLSNGCGATLAGGANCTVQIAANAAASGTRTAYLSVVSNSPASPQYLTLTATASTGTGIATLSAKSITMTDSGLSHDITLTNTGNGYLTFNSATTATSLFSASNNCGAGLAAGSSCAISVTNHSPAPDPFGLTYAAYGGFGNIGFYDQLTVTTSGNSSPQSVLMTANNARTILPSNIVFPAVAPGTTVSTTVSMQLGSLPASCPAGTVSNSAYSVSAGTFVSSGTRTYNCTYTLSFTPGTAGTTTPGKLSFGDYIPLSGTSVASGLVVLTGTNPYTLTNNGSTTINIQSITASQGFAQTNNCGGSLPGQSLCTITTSASNAVLRLGGQGTLSILDDAGLQAAALCTASLAAGASCTVGVTFAPTTSGSKSANLNFEGGTDSITGTAQ